MFLALERKRESLVVGTRRQLRPGKRYEDLCLVKMVTHLQRDYLSRARRHEAQTDGRPRSETARAEREVPDWAMPWGPGCLVQLQSDLHDFDERLANARRWLTTAGQVAAEARALDRFARLMDQMAEGLEAARLGVPEWASRRALTERRRANRRKAAKPAARRRGVQQRRSHGSARDRSPGGRAAAPARSRSSGNGRIDVNEATYEQLRSLKLSTTQSRRLLAYRQRIQGFRSLNELDAIPGFSSGVLEQLKQRLST
jgi:DNA uptake protein ComE-like DNA-binding protein